ncbi:hypothetical protein BGY98DRAFT_89725 [Russula aff. rugulosa BPL654]|nr:hypothetical protein BGY98DRAFT_89725 [Russula aff. rugulosa BPL654]
MVVGTHTHQSNFQYTLVPFLPLAVQESTPLCDHEVHHWIDCCSIPPCTCQCSVFLLSDYHHWDSPESVTTYPLLMQVPTGSTGPPSFPVPLPATWHTSMFELPLVRTALRVSLRTMVLRGFRCLFECDRRKPAGPSLILACNLGNNLPSDHKRLTLA